MSRRRPDDPAPWRTLKSAYQIEQAPYMTLRQDHLQLPNGSEIERYWVQEFPPWVSVVAVTDAQHIVLIRQYRPGLAQVHFEIPAGYVDAQDGDDLQGAARRELLEETGYGGGTWTKLCALAPNAATQDNLSHTYLAKGVTRIASPQTEHTEDIRTHLVPRDEIKALIDNGDIVQALHVAPLLRYLLD